ARGRGTGAAARRAAHQPHRGGRHRRRRGGAVLGPARAPGGTHGARAARGAVAAGGRRVPGPLERRGELMGAPAKADVARLPEPDVAREWLATMTLIRRFEERAGEMYARAKVGGFLHLSIGEEATIVGSARALRPTDYLVSTYRSHGHALVRGTPPGKGMAELFGGDRPAGERRGTGRAGHELRRHGRAGHPRGAQLGGGARAHRAPAGAGGGDHVPLSRPLDGRSRAVPHQGGGGAVARARP